MPLAVHARSEALAGLEHGVLDVAYRASEAPQTVDVRVKLAGATELPLVPWAIGTLVGCIDAGIAGGAEFAPSAGRAKLEAGPKGQGPIAAGELGPDYAFRLEVAGMAPRFLRTFVEYLATAGAGQRLVALSIVGELPPDGTRRSVRERQLLEWMEQPEGYVEAWPSPGFRVVTKSIPRGAMLRVRLAPESGAAGANAPTAAISDEAAASLEAAFSAWQSAVLTYPNARKRARGLMDPHATFARSRTEFFAKVSLFDVAREPARAALLNALGAVHARGTRIEEVEIATA